MFNNIPSFKIMKSKMLRNTTSKSLHRTNSTCHSDSVSLPIDPFFIRLSCHNYRATEEDCIIPPRRTIVHLIFKNVDTKCTSSQETTKCSAVQYSTKQYVELVTLSNN